MKEYKDAPNFSMPVSWVAWIVVFALLQVWPNVVLMLVWKKATIYLAWLQIIITACICTILVVAIPIEELSSLMILGMVIGLGFQGLYIKYLGGKTAQTYIKS